MDGRPLRDHLESIARQTGVVPEQLADAPDCPEGCERLWRDFLELHSMRGMIPVAGGAPIPSRITFHDIDAMQRVRGVTLRPWQVNAVLAADMAYFEVRAAA